MQMQANPVEIVKKDNIDGNTNINKIFIEYNIDSIIELLQHTYLPIGTIARIFNVEVHTISRINEGVYHRKDNIKYPIRNWKSCGKTPLTYEQVTDIIHLIKNSNLSLHKIAKQYNVNNSIIKMINNGSAKKYKRNNIKYPIRPF